MTLEHQASRGRSAAPCCSVPLRRATVSHHRAGPARGDGQPSEYVRSRWTRRLLTRDGHSAATVDEVETLVTAYERVFDAIAKALPGRVIRLDAADPHFAPG